MTWLDLHELNESAVSAARSLDVDDAVALSSRSADSMIRFANNSVTVVNRVEEAELTVYLAKDRRKAIASTSNLDRSAVRKFVRDLFASMKGLPESEYAPLPDQAARYSPSRLGFDKKLENIDDELPDLARRAIDSALSAGGRGRRGSSVPARGRLLSLPRQGPKGLIPGPRSRSTSDPSRKMKRAATDSPAPPLSPSSIPRTQGGERGRGRGRCGKLPNRRRGSIRYC